VGPGGDLDRRVDRQASSASAAARAVFLAQGELDTILERSMLHQQEGARA
jgi:hypothetical protein